MNAPLHREIPASVLDAAQALSQVSAQWDGDIVKQITDYITCLLYTSDAADE